MIGIKTINSVIVAVFLAMLLSACGGGKKLNERVTIWRKDKIPYGTFYAFEQLPQLFPNAEIVIDKDAPGENNLSFFKKSESEILTKRREHKGKTVEFIISPTVMPSETELNAMLNFAYEGNQLFISAFEFGQGLLDSLKLETTFDQGYYRLEDSLELSITNPISFEQQSYAYPGKTYDNSFSSLDTEYIRVLGRDYNDKPNFVKISYEGGGAIYVHLAPVAFTNFFLLHKQNKVYYDCALSNMPEKTELVVWGEYFRNHAQGQGRNKNSTARIFQWMMSQPPLAWALSLAMLLFLLIFLFESKRKQREITERKPLRNATLDFVKTIGSLYYQRRDNKNLAAKMTAHFQDHVRNRFNIPTSRMDTDFEKRLAYKTGIDAEVIHDIVYQSKFLADQPSVTDGELLIFNQQLKNFYKQV